MDPDGTTQPFFFLADLAAFLAGAFFAGAGFFDGAFLAAPFLPPNTLSQFDQKAGVVPVRTIGPLILNFSRKNAADRDLSEACETMDRGLPRSID